MKLANPFRALSELASGHGEQKKVLKDEIIVVSDLIKALNLSAR